MRKIYKFLRIFGTVWDMDFKFFTHLFWNICNIPPENFVENRWFDNCVNLWKIEFRYLKKCCRSFLCAKKIALKKGLFTFPKTLLLKRSKNYEWKFAWTQNFLYENETEILFFCFTGLKSHRGNQVAQKTVLKFCIPQMTCFLISNPKSNYFH